MGVNKVEYGGETLIDLTNDTVTPETLAEGVTAHGADGEQIIGTMSLNKVTDLKGLTYYIPSGWKAVAGYGKFSVNCDIAYLASNQTRTRFSLGYAPSGIGMSPTANYLLADNGSGIGVTNGFSFSNTEAFTITFNGGNTTNTSLIDWVTTWGELQESDRYDEGYNDGYNAGHTVGYNEGCDYGYENGRRAGYTDGYEEGASEALGEAYTIDNIPLIIQGLNSANEYGLYDERAFDDTLTNCIRHDFFTYDVTTDSSCFSISFVNHSTTLTLYAQVYVEATFNFEDGEYEEADTITITILPDSSTSRDIELGVGASQHVWAYTIEGVKFSK